MSPGRLLGEGRTAEVREYGTDKVVKLLRPEFDPELLDGKSATHRAAVQAGAPAPGIHGKVSIGGRGPLSESPELRTTTSSDG